MNRLIERCKAESMNVDAGLPQEVARLAGTYGWVRPLTQAIGYKESMPDPEGTVPNPDKIRRAILANTIGFVWSQSEQFRDVIPFIGPETPSMR